MRRLASRSGVTLVEGLVGFTLAAVLSVMLWQGYAAGRRQGEQIEEYSDIVVAALLLRERLAVDLETSISLDALAEDQRAPGEERPTVVLPVFKRYRGDLDAALEYETVTYQWDAGAARLTRNGQQILRAVQLTKVGFRWTVEAPILLEVDLVGRENVRGRPARMTLRLPAPKGTEAFPNWVFAPHHRPAVPGG